MMLKMLASAAAVALFAPAASAAVLTFDAYSVGASTTDTRGSNGPIIEDGFRLSSALCNDPSPSFPAGRCFSSVQRLAETASGRSIDRSTTSAAMRTVFQGQNITLEQVNGGAFTFGGIDIKSDYGTTATNVDFIYTLLDGTVGSQRFALPPGRDNELGATYRLANVGAITRLVFDPVERNGGFQFDNIVVAAVPEPATWAMMIGGMGVVGGSLRRRKAALAAA